LNRFCPAVVLLLACLSWCPSFSRTAIADNGGFKSMRYAKTMSPPFNLATDDTWVSCDGYRPVRVTITPIGSATFRRDREITLEVKKAAIHERLFGDYTRQTVELPEGAKQVEVLLLYQQSRSQHWASLRVWEGRETLRNVSRQNISELKNGASVPPEGVPTMLIIDLDIPRLADRQTTIGRFRGENEAAIPNPIGFVKNVPALNAMRTRVDDEFGESWVDIAEQISSISFQHPEDLPKEWLALSGIDIVYVSLSELQAIQTEHPAQWNAIDRWLRSGGNLWVADVGAGFKELKNLESLCGLKQSEEGAGEGADKSSFATQWQYPAKGKYGEKVDSLQSEDGQWRNGAYVNEDVMGKPPKFQEIQIIEFAHRDLQLGRIAAFAAAEPLAEEEKWNWQWIFKSLDIDRWCWSKRHGFSPTRFNDGYWEYLIPDVGLAPVNSFRVIITLFVLAVGPLNYTWLNRRGRMNWMLFTVPAAALLVTCALLGYAMVTDGVSAKSRIRSLMDIDQQAGQASILARQTYYAGIAPAGGITFDEQTAVFPVDHDAAERTYRGGQDRNLEWTDGGQVLQSGYLPSRTTSQFLTIQSQTSSLQLQFTRDAAGKPTAAKNLLGAEAQVIVIRDYDGTFYIVEDCPNGADCKLTEATLADVGDLTDPYIELADRSLPPGVDLSLLGNSQNRWRFSNSRLGAPTSETSRLEQSIEQALLRWKSQPPGSYTAILKDNTLLDCAVRSKDRKHELHIIRGNF